MKYDPEIHHRRSIRLKGYDYLQSGAYFITLCTHNRECLFGEIPVGAGSKPALSIVGLEWAGLEWAGLEPAPTQYRNIVQFTWNDLTNHITGIVLDEFVIMPNHVHGIIQITGAGLERAGLEPAPTGLPEIVRQFKTFSAKRINATRNSPGISVWQRNYYEHIIRNEHELNKIREYIQNNPLNWDSDRINPSYEINDAHKELDFIINYDIKYRMDKELDNEKEDEKLCVTEM